MNQEFPPAVADTSGGQYPLGAMLGRGGQGAVFAVRGRPLAVKLADAKTRAARRKVQENIARVKRLPLDGLNVARPLRALAPPQVGYVMELMTGMMPLSKLAFVPKAKAEDFSTWYLETGGLLRRLRLLAKVADLFKELHGRGLSYGDASPANIFVSKDMDAEETWLIDCDNLYSGVNRRGVYTPGYAAPELLRHHGADSLTDAWSFAVIAFQTLCVLHPFVGDDVHDGEPELEERAFRGELPWVDDPSGDNEASRGLPREMVLSPQLQQLSQDCFGKSRTDRQARPGVSAWAERLHRAADQTLVCPECQSSYFLNFRECPWCDEPRPSFATASIYLRDLELTDRARNPFNLVCKVSGKPTPIHRVVCQAGRDVVFSDRVLRGTTDSEPRIYATLDEQRLTLRGTPECRQVLRHREGRVLKLLNATEHLDLSGGRPSWWLLPDNATGLHRALVFRWHAGGSR